MTLKEELSIDYRKALEEEHKKFEPSADAEMRDIINHRIYPIIKLIHKKCPTLKNLKVRTEFRSFLTFDPIPWLYNHYDSAEIKNEYHYEKNYSPKVQSNHLIHAAARLCPEFDLEFLPDEHDDCIFTFKMTLDD